MSFGSGTGAPSVELTLDEGRRVFAPGDEVTGTVSWHLDEDPGVVALRLYWRTEGRGTADVETVAEEEFEAPGLRDQRSFSFRLPAGPYSFSGTLISLIWGLELVAEPHGALAGVDLVVSHGVGEVRLTSVDGEDGKGGEAGRYDKDGADASPFPEPPGGGWSDE